MRKASWRPRHHLWAFQSSDFWNSIALSQTQKSYNFILNIFRTRLSFSNNKLMKTKTWAFIDIFKSFRDSLFFSLIIIILFVSHATAITSE